MGTTVAVAQLARAKDCGSLRRGFEPHLSPISKERAQIIYMGLDANSSDNLTARDHKAVERYS